jgi:hypothetical protein
MEKTTAEKIAKLVEQFGESVPVLDRKKLLGIIPVTIRHGWLWVEDNDSTWRVFLANGKSTHQPLDGTLVGADIRKDNSERKTGPGELTGTWTSAVSVWPITDEKEALSVFGRILSGINLAFRHHCGNEV